MTPPTRAALVVGAQAGSVLAAVAAPRRQQALAGAGATVQQDRATGAAATAVVAVVCAGCAVCEDGPAGEHVEAPQRPELDRAASSAAVAVLPVAEQPPGDVAALATAGAPPQAPCVEQIVARSALGAVLR